MSFKNLLVTFVTSEEASITQRLFFNVGAMLTGVVLVAMVIVGLTSQRAWADNPCCPAGCCGETTCGSWSSEPDCGGTCTKYTRSCFTGCVEYYIQCPGDPSRCSC